MKVLLLQIDGKIPNLALMRIGAHHRALGDKVVLERTLRPASVDRALFFEQPEKVYASQIFHGPDFQWSVETVRYLKRVCQVNLVVGGTGESATRTLESVGIGGLECDYSLYPAFRSSIGFTQRGCRLRCQFCIVPEKEGAVKHEQTVAEIWRGDPWPRELLLLDNDFFGQAEWRERIGEIRDGGFKVSFNQGINARMLNRETAEAIASVNYRDDSMKVKRIYTAWDNKKDESRLVAGLEELFAAGVKPDHVMVYMLIGFWPGETVEDWLYRQAKLRALGVRPYPMPFRRTREAIGFQRWVVRRYDLVVPWEKFSEARYRPERCAIAS